MYIYIPRQKSRLFGWGKCLFHSFPNKLCKGRKQSDSILCCDLSDFFHWNLLDLCNPLTADVYIGWNVPHLQAYKQVNSLVAFLHQKHMAYSAISMFMYACTYTHAHVHTQTHPYKHRHRHTHTHTRKAMKNWSGYIWTSLIIHYVSEYTSCATQQECCLFKSKK